MKICFIQTGGTIDKCYPRTTKGWAFEIGEPAVSSILNKLNPSFEYEIISCCKKDSQEITLDDREQLAAMISSTDCEHIVITHGTDTMIETANYLAESSTQKRIILTGAFLPQKFTDTDADTNLGIAIGALQFIENGVYVAMNGKVQMASQSNRNHQTGKFNE